MVHSSRCGGDDSSYGYPFLGKERVISRWNPDASGARANRQYAVSRDVAVRRGCGAVRNRNAPYHFRTTAGCTSFCFLLVGCGPRIAPPSRSEKGLLILAGSFALSPNRSRAETIRPGNECGGACCRRLKVPWLSLEAPGEGDRMSWAVAVAARPRGLFEHSQLERKLDEGVRLHVKMRLRTTSKPASVQQRRDMRRCAASEPGAL
jgi:hypothetical protein